MTENKPMLPAELKSIMLEIYGQRNQRLMATEFGINEVSLSRWMSGHVKIDRSAAILFRLVCALHRRGTNWRKQLEEFKPRDKRFEDML